jgi:acyl-CoA dehydrogenase
MNFEFSAEQLFIRDQARNFLNQECPTSVVRAVMDSGATFDRDLWQKIVALGWTATAIPEAYGGLGLGYLELCVIAEELGRALAPVPFSSSVYLAAEAIKSWGTAEQKQYFLPKLAAGDCIGTLALNEGLGAQTVAAQVRDGKLTAHKLPVPDGDSADIAIVTARDAHGHLGLYLAMLDHAGVQRETLGSMDPSRAQARLVLHEVPCQPLGDKPAGDAELAQLLDRAAVLLAFEQIGGAQAAMDKGIAYTKDRYAFGRPIASFQAIKHKFADMFVALELARSNAYYGACALAGSAPDLPLAAATARVSASDAFYLIAKENIQVHGGMGFTWEFDCHLYYRRAQTLASVIGTQPQWKEQLTHHLLQSA